jgi:hypothetical protein
MSTGNTGYFKRKLSPPNAIEAELKYISIGETQYEVEANE